MYKKILYLKIRNILIVYILIVHKESMSRLDNFVMFARDQVAMDAHMSLKGNVFYILYCQH